MYVGTSPPEVDAGSTNATLFPLRSLMVRMPLPQRVTMMLLYVGELDPARMPTAKASAPASCSASRYDSGPNHATSTRFLRIASITPV